MAAQSSCPGAQIRPARLEDAPAIYALLATFSTEGKLLPRPVADIQARIGNFLVIEQNGEQLLLQSTNEEQGYRTLRILAENFHAVGRPKYLTNDMVRIPGKNREGRIYSVTWHGKRNCFRYMVDYGDRKSTCWYFDEDLEKLEVGGEVKTKEAKP